MSALAALLLLQAAPLPAEQVLKDFLDLNMVLGACEAHASPFLLRDVDDIVAASNKEVQALVREYRAEGRAKLAFTIRDCRYFLPKALAKARLP